MSDGPLFQNADEQERIYAPQQVPTPATAGEAAASADDDEALAANIAPTPGVAFEAAGAGTGAGESAGTAGTGQGVVPALGAVALAQESAKDDARER